LDARPAFLAGKFLPESHCASEYCVQVLRQRFVALGDCVVRVSLAHERLPLVAVRYAVVLVAARLCFNYSNCDQQCEDDNGSRDNMDRDSFENAVSFCHW